MEFYSGAAVERAMKIQEGILRAMAKKITWWQASEIIGNSDRHMRRWNLLTTPSGFAGAGVHSSSGQRPRPLAIIKSHINFVPIRCCGPERHPPAQS